MQHLPDFDNATNEQLFTKTIFTLALRLSHYQQNEKYSEAFWGTDEDLAFENYAYLATNKLMGFDVNEDEKWGSYLIKATVTEICEYSIAQLMKAFSQYVPQANKVFAVACSSINMTNYENVLASAPDKFQLKKEEQLSILCHTNNEQITALINLPVKHTLFNKCHFPQSIIRIR